MGIRIYKCEGWASARTPLPFDNELDIPVKVSTTHSVAKENSGGSTRRTILHNNS